MMRWWSWGFNAGVVVIYFKPYSSPLSPILIDPTPHTLLGTFPSRRLVPLPTRLPRSSIHTYAYQDRGKTLYPCQYLVCHLFQRKVKCVITKYLNLGSDNKSSQFYLYSTFETTGVDPKRFPVEADGLRYASIQVNNIKQQV